MYISEEVLVIQRKILKYVLVDIILCIFVFLIVAMIFGDIHATLPCLIGFSIFAIHGICTYKNRAIIFAEKNQEYTFYYFIKFSLYMDVIIGTLLLITSIISFIRYGI